MMAKLSAKRGSGRGGGCPGRSLPLVPDSTQHTHDAAGLYPACAVSRSRHPLANKPNRYAIIIVVLPQEEETKEKKRKKVTVFWMKTISR